jgi:transcriptional regulator with XRE-family HTH domain
LCDHDKKLQSLLRQLRKEAGFSQQELAAALDKPQSFVSKYESGERKLDILELRQICQKLGIDIVRFIMRLEDVLGDERAAKS